MMSVACAPMHTGSRTAGKDLSVKPLNYVTALALWDHLWEKESDDFLFDEHYELAEKIRNAGDNEYEQGNFAQAGSIYNRLLESRIISKISSQDLSFNREYLKKQIRACSKALTELGIIKYREQKLNEAIAIWRQILEFEPQNGTIAKAIRTAGKQQYSLRRLE